MNKALPVIDTHANHEENIERIIKLLGRSKLRFEIVDLIHGRGNRPKTVSQILEKLRLDPDKRQLVLNQVNYLSKHKLISKTSVQPLKRAKQELAYGKNEFVMANKQEIVRKRNRPELLAKTPTKRRPQISKSTTGSRRQPTVRTRRRRSAKLRVLYLTATPDSQKPLRTEAEVRMVQDEVRGSKFRDEIDVVVSPAADTKSILNGINDHRPQIVHFSGHGGAKAIWLDDGCVKHSVGGSIRFDLLAETLAATSSPPTLLVLNACDTLKGAGVLLDAVKIVVAMSDSISDIGAASFAAQFYAAIASAQPIATALKQGKVAMKHAMLADFDLPELIHHKSVDPNKLVLVSNR